MIHIAAGGELQAAWFTFRQIKALQFNNAFSNRCSFEFGGRIEGESEVLYERFDFIKEKREGNGGFADGSHFNQGEIAGNDSFVLQIGDTDDRIEQAVRASQLFDDYGKLVEAISMTGIEKLENGLQEVDVFVGKWNCDSFLLQLIDDLQILWITEFAEFFGNFSAIFAR